MTTTAIQTTAARPSLGETDNGTRAPTTHEAAMIRARAALADLHHIRRDILTLRETMAFR